MYENYGQDGYYGSGGGFDYNQQGASMQNRQGFQRGGLQQSWSGRQDGGEARPMQNMAGNNTNMAAQQQRQQFDNYSAPPPQDRGGNNTMMQRNLGQSVQNPYNHPSDPQYDNTSMPDKTARAYAFMQRVDEDKKRTDELEEQKQEVQRLRLQVKQSMETLHSLQGDPQDAQDQRRDWQRTDDPTERQKSPVRSILKRSRGDEEDDQAQSQGVSQNRQSSTSYTDYLVYHQSLKQRKDQKDGQPRTNYCDVCSIQFNTIREYQQHCSGLLHTKQLMQQKMGISIDKDDKPKNAEESDPSSEFYQGNRPGQGARPAWGGNNQSAETNPPPMDLDAIYSAFDDYEEEAPSSMRRQSTSQVSNTGGNVRCKLCNDNFFTNEAMRKHSTFADHCKKYLFMQASMGTEKFMAKYGDVPFGMEVKPLNAACERHVRTDLSNKDVSYYKEFLARSGTLNGLQCKICHSGTYMMEHWFAHCVGKKHTKTCISNIMSMNPKDYLNMYGDIPGPAPSKAIDSKMIPKWESVFIIEALTTVTPPIRSLLQEQQALEQARDQQKSLNEQTQISPLMGANQGRNKPYQSQVPQGMSRDALNRSGNDQGSPLQEMRGRPGINNPDGLQNVQHQNMPARANPMGENNQNSQSVHDQLQAHYQKQHQPSLDTELDSNNQDNYPQGPGPDRFQGRGGLGNRQDPQFDRGGYNEPGRNRPPVRGPPLDARGPLPNSMGSASDARGPPRDSSMNYGRGQYDQDNSQFANSASASAYDTALPDSQDEPYEYENPFNQSAPQPQRQTQQGMGYEHGTPGRPQVPERDPYAQQRPSQHDQQRPSQHDQQRPSQHDQQRPSQHETQGQTDKRGHDKPQGRDGRDRDLRNNDYDRSRNRDRSPADRREHSNNRDRPDNRGRDSRDRSEYRDRDKSDNRDRDSRPRSDHQDGSDSRGRSDNRGRSENRERLETRNKSDNANKSTKDNMYDPFEADGPKQTSEVTDATVGGVVPTSKALHMLHQIQEKQRFEQEKLEKKLKKQQELLDKQKKELERERQKHKQEIERQQKELKEKQQKLEEEKREEEMKRKAKERELEKEKKLRLDEKRKQLQMKDDLERKRLQRQREEAERKRLEKIREEEERKKKEAQEKADQAIKQQRLKEELQRKVQEEVEAKRQDKLKKEIEERVKQAELQKLKDKEAELERILQAKKMEMSQPPPALPLATLTGRGRGRWNPVPSVGQAFHANDPGRGNHPGPNFPMPNHPVPSHLIPVPRSMIGVMGMRPAFPAGMTSHPPPQMGLMTPSPVAQAGLMHAAPWNAATAPLATGPLPPQSGAPPPTSQAPQVPMQAPWNKFQDSKPAQTPAVPQPTPLLPPPWADGKTVKKTEPRQPDCKPETKRDDMPWKRKEGRTQDAAKEMPWKHKESKIQDDSKDMPWKRKDERPSGSKESDKSGRERRGEKKDIDQRDRREGRERPLGRERDEAWSRDHDARKPRSTNSRGKDLIDLTQSPELNRSDAPWHKKASEEIPQAPWSGLGKKPAAEGSDAPWAGRRTGTHSKPVEPGHTYKLVLDERDQRSWKGAQADFVHCMDSGENTERPLKLFTNTLQIYMRRIQDAKSYLPEAEIFDTLSPEERQVTKQIQQMTGLEPISVVTCTLHLLQAMDPRVFNILGSMDPNFMQSLISDAMAGGRPQAGSSRGLGRPTERGIPERGHDRASERRPDRRSERGPERGFDKAVERGERRRSHSPQRVVPPWLRGGSHPGEEEQEIKRGRWA